MDKHFYNSAFIQKQPALAADAAEQKSEVPSSRQDRLRRRWIRLAVAGFGGGILNGVFGLILGIESYAGLLLNPTAANTTANLLLIAAFILMMLGAHALDRISSLQSQTDTKDDSSL